MLSELITVDAVVQVVILLFGLAAIWLTQQPRESLRRYACICGLISQPFFVYATFVGGQWGMFVLSICYTLIWLMGVRTFWFSGSAAQTGNGDESLNYDDIPHLDDAFYEGAELRGPLRHGKAK